jgi:hypothetical protein
MTDNQLSKALGRALDNYVTNDIVNEPEPQKHVYISQTGNGAYRVGIGYKEAEEMVVSFADEDNAEAYADLLVENLYKQGRSQ